MEFIDWLYRSSWITKAFIGLGTLVIFDLSVPFFKTSFGARPEAILLNWSIGQYISTVLFIVLVARSENGLHVHDLYQPWLAIACVVVLGGTVGLIMNISISQALATAPNVGMASVIIASAAGVVYLVAPILHPILPKAFPAMEFSWRTLLGVAFVILGLFFITKR